MDNYEQFRCRTRVPAVALVFGRLPLSGRLAVENLIQDGLGSRGSGVPIRDPLVLPTPY